MTTVDYLNQIKKYDFKIQNKIAELSQLRLMVYGLPSSKGNDEERVQTSFEPDKIGTAVSKIVDMENELDGMIGEMVRQRNKIVSQIDAIADIDNYHILSLRFVQRLPFSKIEEETNYSKSKVQRVYDSAIIEFERKYGDEYLNSEPK